MRSRPRQAERGRRAAAGAAWGVLALLVAGPVAQTAAQNAPLSAARALWSPADPDQVDVDLHGAPREPRLLTDPRQWTIEGRDLRDGTKVRMQPERVEFVGGVATLYLGRPLALRDGQGADLLDVRVHYTDADADLAVPVRQGGHASARSGTAPARRYVAARGPGDADIYLSGALTTAPGARPTYTADVKLSHGVFTSSGARFDAGFALSAARQTNLDPDAITGALSYRRVFGGARLDLRVDLLSGEYARQDDRFNLATGVRLAVVPRSLRLAPRTYVAFEPFAGVEAGRNLARSEPAGDRNVIRPLAGASAYIVAFQPGGGLDRITLGATFTLRLPRTDEPYSAVRDGVDVSSLTRRARPHVAADLAFQFAAGYSLSLQYRHGSLPPAFRRLEHRLALGFSVQLKRP